MLLLENLSLEICEKYFQKAYNAGDKTSRSSKVTTEPQEVFIEGDIKDEPQDISENIDAVTGEFITGD